MDDRPITSPDTVSDHNQPLGDASETPPRKRPRAKAAYVSKFLEYFIVYPVVFHEFLNFCSEREVFRVECGLGTHESTLGFALLLITRRLTPRSYSLGNVQYRLVARVDCAAQNVITSNRHVVRVWGWELNVPIRLEILQRNFHPSCLLPAAWECT